jgi:hypothetical protein
MPPTDRARSAHSWYVIAPIGIAAAAAIGSVLVFSGGGGDRRDRGPVDLSGPVAIDRERVGERAAALPIPIPAMPSADAIAAAAAEAARREAEAQAQAQAQRAQQLEQARSAGVLGSAALLEGGAFASLTGTGDISSGFEDRDIQGGLIGNPEGEAAFAEATGGFGGPGFGPGGGGQGDGTTVGTLGHGSGTGQGYGTGTGRGGMRARARAVPEVRIGQPQATGDLDKAIIRRYIKRSIARITYCYEKQLLARPGLEGTVRTQFTISPSGAVSSSTASGMNDDVASCVADVIRAIEFPRPKGGSVDVVYPFSFRPDGG